MPKANDSAGKVGDTGAFPSPELDGFVPIESIENPDGSTTVVYAQAVPEGCNKRTLTLKDGAAVSDSTEFKRAAYIHERTVNGVPYRYELIGGND